MIFQIKLATEKDAVNLVHKMVKYSFDIDACVGYYTVDAKSILGVLGLGTGKTLKIVANTDFNKELENDLKEFLQ